MYEGFKNTIQVPGPLDKVYKDQCCFTYYTPESDGGLYICLHTFIAFSRKFVQFYHEVTGLTVFLHTKKTKVPIIRTDASPDNKRPKRLGIGIEGGFNTEEDFEWRVDNKIVILPAFTELTVEDAAALFGENLSESVNTILTRDSAAKEDLVAWDGEVRNVSQHAQNLVQLDNGVKIPPSGWKCRDCDRTNNLWLNLTDGTILCGRKYHDGTGGNNGGLNYYKKTGYPLAVKLGTITPQGADVFSYVEDDMVEDPNLAQHLAHFGINMMQMHKTEQTMTEMEIDLNEKVGSEWDIIQESGKKLVPLHCAGATGIRNMGNTCYMNSVLQVLYSTPDFINKYSDCKRCMESFKKHLQNLNIEQSIARQSKQMNDGLRNKINDMMWDLTFQLTKLGYALQQHEKNSEENSEEKEDAEKVHPWPAQLKRVVGRNHAEFNSIRQQDAHEYMLYLFTLMEKNQLVSGHNCSDAFKFVVEERLECQQSNQVRYKTNPEFGLSVEVSLDHATNKDEVEKYKQLKAAGEKDGSVSAGEIVRAKIPFEACLGTWMGEETIEFLSPATNERGEAKKRIRFATFPDFLAVHVKKFTVDKNWIPTKLDVSMQMPDNLDLGELRSPGGLQTGEQPLPEGEDPKPKGEELAQVDEVELATMVSMGFPEHQCRRALQAVKGAGPEAAMNWIFSNPESANEPVVEQSGSSSEPNEGNIEQMMSMGFTRPQCIAALNATNDNYERAVDWMLSHLDTWQSASGDNAQVATSNSATAPTDGHGKYEMFAFVSHCGPSSMSGHYVCHIKKNGKWIIFNDEKVAESVEPPKDLGYLYFYKRSSN